jgi:iron complex outermembrane receptor protein
MKKLFLVLCIGAALQAAFAQEIPNDGEVGESGAGTALDFVVTAGRTLEEASKVAGQLTVITAEDIAESGAANVTELLETVPGVRLAKDRSGTGVDISMRGISSDKGRNKVLVIVDGVRLNPVQGMSVINWDSINLSDVERIEILDGGASVQYGDNAQVGVINIITKKSGAAKTDVTVSGGSFFQNEQCFSHHQPTEWGSFTVSGGHRGTQGYQKHTANDTGSGEVRGTFDINDSMSLQANVGFAFTNGLLSNGLTKDQFDDDPTQNAGPADSNFSTTGINTGMGFAWAITDTLNLNVPVSYNYTNLKSQIPAYSRVYDYTTPLMLGIRPQISAELKPAGMSLRLTGGIDTLIASTGVNTGYDLVKETNLMKQKMSELTIGPWALAGFEPLPFLSVNAGIRYDAAFVNAHMDAWSGTVSGMPITFTEADESTDWNAFVYEAGIAVNPLDFLKVYAKYGTQFRYPYLDELVVLPVAGGSLSLNTGLEPEKGWTVEGGIGVTIKNITKLDANFYYLNIDNEITEILTPPMMSYTPTNMEPINRLGTNIGLTLTPFKDYIELNVDYGFVKAEFSEGVYEGKDVPLVAAHTLSGSLMLRFPFGLSFGPDVLYKSEMYPGFDYDNALPVIDPSMIWGASVRYEPKKFDGNLALQLVLHNLADAKYATLGYGVGTQSRYFIDTNMGRSVKVLVQYRF